MVSADVGLVAADSPSELRTMVLDESLTTVCHEMTV
jgi:hypothetical protein